MTPLQHDLKRFYLRLSLRLASYAALWGLVLSLPIVIAAPWLREWYGFPDYWTTMAIPVILPAIYAGLVLFIKPPEREQVLVADHWFGRTGTIVSAYELERSRPGDPFIEPVSKQARSLMHDRPLPEPRWLRRALIALAVLLLLTPLSRWAHAQMQENKREAEKEKQAKKPEVKPQDAETVAKSAGDTAEKAKQAGAKQQENLASDIEEAARRAQSGADDKERAMRSANALADRARAQSESQERRQNARDAMKGSKASRELAEAIESNDPRRINEAVRKATEEIYKPNGEIDPVAAEELRKAVEKARQKAPNDPALKRAAEALEAELGKARKEGQSGQSRQVAEEKALRERMAKNGASDQEISKAIEDLQKEFREKAQVDAAELKKALEELAKAADPKRDIDPSGKRADELRKKLEKGDITPEQARELVELARELARKNKIDAETLREMIRRGKEFEGMEEMAKKVVEEARAKGMRPEDVPDWAKNAIPEEWRKAAEEMAREGRNRQPGEGNPGEGKPGEGNPAEGKPGEGNPGGEGSPDGNPDKDTGSNPRTGPDGKPIGDHEIRKEGVDVKDTGQGDKDPNSKEKDLDVKRAEEERAKREATGRKGTGDDVNTKEELDRLPRRYRDAAKKYFERENK